MTTQDFSILREADALDTYALVCTFLTAVVPPASLDLQALISAFVTSDTPETQGFWSLMRAALLTNHVPLYQALLEEETPMDCVAELCRPDFIGHFPSRSALGHAKRAHVVHEPFPCSRMRPDRRFERRGYGQCHAVVHDSLQRIANSQTETVAHDVYVWHVRVSSASRPCGPI